MTSPHIQRATLLLEQSRFDLAEQELRKSLTDEPNNAVSHSLLAVCLAERKQYQAATDEAQIAIHLAPDQSFHHYALARVFSDRNRLAEAERAIFEAIRLDPWDADYFGLLASIRFTQRRWKDALEAAEHGLKIDAEDSMCANIQAMALVKLGRTGQADAAIRTALSREPEDALTHANLGWTLIEQGNYEKAMEHFREALRIEPSLDWAREGIAQSLKARYFFYRIFLGFILWITKLDRRMQWGIVVGGFIGYQVLVQLAKRQPALAPYVWPLIAVYVGFVIMTWLADPLFNLLLRLNRYGRMALLPKQVFISNWVGICVAGALVSLACYFVLGHTHLLIAAATFGFTLPPFTRVFKCDEGWPRTSAITLTAVVAGTGTLAVVSLAGGLLLPGLGGALLMLAGLALALLFGVSALGSQFATNFLASVRVRK